MAITLETAVIVALLTLAGTVITNLLQGVFKNREVATGSKTTSMTRFYDGQERELERVRKSEADLDAKYENLHKQFFELTMEKAKADQAAALRISSLELRIAQLEDLILRHGINAPKSDQPTQ